MRQFTVSSSARRLLVFGALCATLSTPARAQSSSSSSSSAPPTPLDLRAYEAQLDEWSTAVAKGRHDPIEIGRVRKTVPAELSVRTAQGDIRVATGWLSTSLSNLEQDPQQADGTARGIEQRLAALRRAAQELDEASAAWPAADTRSQLDKIFQHREFRGLSGPTEWQLLMERISRWIFEQVYKLLRKLHINAKAGNFLAWCVIGLAFVLLCVWLVRRLIHLSRTPGGEAAQAPTAAMTSREWRDEALAAAERGDYREAIHCAYWAAVTRLEDTGALPRDRSRTPRESLHQLDTNPKEQQLLRDLTRRFELIWYGYRPASADDWSGAKIQLEQMGCLKASTAATASS